MMRDESLSEALTRLRADAERLGAVDVTAELDQVDARLADERDRVLRKHFADGEGD